MSNGALNVFAEAQIKHSESKQKVADAISKILPLGELRIGDDRVTLSSDKLESLKFLKDHFRDRRIRSAARRLLLKNSTELQTELLLNKQAATVGIAALCDDPRESALGPIVLRIHSNNVNEVIDWLTQGYDDKS